MREYCAEPRGDCRIAQPRHESRTITALLRRDVRTIVGRATARVMGKKKARGSIARRRALLAFQQPVYFSQLALLATKYSGQLITYRAI